MVSIPPALALDWPRSHRIIRTLYPPIWLFEDIADPADWDAIANGEAKTDPLFRDEIGDIRLVPAERRVSGPTASIVMGAFTHASPARPSRFSTGHYGVWYCGDRFEVALMETVHHFARTMRNTDEPAGDDDFRELVARVSGTMHDITAGYGVCLDPADWTAGQRLAAQLHREGSDGIVYPSVFYPGGSACAAFWPDALRLPVTTGRALRYHWDGEQVTRYFVIGEDAWRELPVVA